MLTRSFRKTQVKAPKAPVSYDLTYLASNLSSAKTAKVQAKVSAPTNRKGRRVDLTSRVGSLKEGKVLDVSNMKEGGANIKSINVPSQSSAKVGIDSFPSVVSSSAANYQTALGMLGFPADRITSMMAEFSRVSDRS